MKEKLPNILNITLSILLAIFSWNAVRLINSVDELSKMVYQHEVKINDQKERIDKLENKLLTVNMNPPINNFPKDGTRVVTFNQELCLTSSQRNKRKV